MKDETNKRTDLNSDNRITTEVDDSTQTLVFKTQEAFANWLTKELEVLEVAFLDFSTVNSFRTSIGR